MQSPRNLAIHFKKAWTRAVKGEVLRANGWKPANREKSSTTHTPRTVCQATLEEASVGDAVID